MDKYTPSCKEFVLNQEKLQQLKELEEKKLLEKAERIKAEKQRMLDNFRAKLDLIVKNQKKQKDLTTTRSQSAEISMEQAVLFQKFEERRLANIRKKEEEFQHTAEGVQQYAARKKKEQELRRDRKFKALL